jgi:hypothetical protein
MVAAGFDRFLVPVADVANVPALVRHDDVVAAVDRRTGASLDVRHLSRPVRSLAHGVLQRSGVAREPPIEHIDTAVSSAAVEEVRGVLSPPFGG